MGDEALQPDEPIFLNQDDGFLEIKENSLFLPAKNSAEEEHQFYSKYPFPFPKEKEEKTSTFNLEGKFHILLVADSFTLCNEGVAAINRSGGEGGFEGWGFEDGGCVEVVVV